jgi:hypothetical protein
LISSEDAGDASDAKRIRARRAFIEKAPSGSHIYDRVGVGVKPRLEGFALVKDVTVNFKFGVRKSKTATVDVDKFANDFATKVVAAVIRDGKAILAGKMASLQEDIRKNVEEDLFKFARRVSTYFMSQKFSRVGAPRIITGGDFDGEAGSEFNSTIWKGKDPPKISHLTWPALAASTVIRKLERPGGASTYYYVWSGELKAEIANAFGDLLAKLIQPSITFTARPARTTGGKFVRGSELAGVKFRLYRDHSDGAIFSRAIGSQDWTQAGDDTTLLRQYMSASMTEKLGNSRNSQNSRDGNKRPWVAPSVAYWIIMRLPNIVIASINKTIADHKAA